MRDKKRAQGSHPSTRSQSSLHRGERGVELQCCKKPFAPMEPGAACQSEAWASRGVQTVPPSRALSFIFFLSLIARYAFYFIFLKNNPVQLAFDSGHYHGVAKQLALGNGFVDAANNPYFYRLPGYPLFLSWMYKLFGINPHYAILVQIVFASLIPLVVWMLVRRIFPQDRLLAMCTSVAVALHLGFVIFSGLVMSESFFCLFFLLFLAPLLLPLGRVWDQNSLGRVREGTARLFLSGLLGGISSLIRPIGSILLLIAALLLAATSTSVKKFLCNASIFFFGWFCIVGIWLLRNFLFTGAFFLHTLSGPHVINHGVVRVVMEAQNCSYEQAQQLVQDDLKKNIANYELAHNKKIEEHEFCDIAQKYAIKEFLSHPYQTAKLCCINMIKTVAGLYSSELLFIDSAGQLPPYQSDRGMWAAVKRFLFPAVHDQRLLWFIYAEIFFHMLMLLGFLGYAWRVLKGYEQAKIFLIICCFIALFVAASCLCGFARLRLPIEPFFIMLSLKFWLQLCFERG